MYMFTFTYVRNLSKWKDGHPSWTYISHIRRIINACNCVPCPCAWVHPTACSYIVLVMEFFWCSHLQMIMSLSTLDFCPWSMLTSSEVPVFSSSLTHPVHPSFNFRVLQLNGGAPLSLLTLVFPLCISWVTWEGKWLASEPCWLLRLLLEAGLDTYAWTSCWGDALYPCVLVGKWGVLWECICYNCCRE